MCGPEIADSVDVSDICNDFDVVAALDEGHMYRATPFVRENEHTLSEASYNLKEYPAIFAVAARGLDVRPLSFVQLKPSESEEPI
jgi:hypothetical protein